MNQVKPCVQVYIQNPLIPTIIYTHNLCHRAVFKKSIPYRQAVQMKRICSEEEDLQHKLGDLESWLVNRGYRTDCFRREIQE